MVRDFIGGGGDLTRESFNFGFAAREVRVIKGGTKSVWPWKNKIAHKVEICDSCTTFVGEYRTWMVENCKGLWEIHSDEWNDRVWAEFALPEDAAHFKLAWG